MSKVRGVARDSWRCCTSLLYVCLAAVDGRVHDRAVNIALTGLVGVVRVLDDHLQNG
jgi:hypothetical protein